MALMRRHFDWFVEWIVRHATELEMSSPLDSLAYDMAVQFCQAFGRNFDEQRFQHAILERWRQESPLDHDY